MVKERRDYTQKSMLLCNNNNNNISQSSVKLPVARLSPTVSEVASYPQAVDKNRCLFRVRGQLINQPPSFTLVKDQEVHYVKLWFDNSK